MKAVDYIKETKGELKHVSWPSRKQTVAYAAIVIAVSAAVALLLGFSDFVFSNLLQRIIG
jgi:preprotein translocase subunit SecE